ncbi:hypothetical protein [Streptomyces sp. NPDC050355]|uniref:hypothetical protein n=1 Tax=Streptomyces sp. NPDC050355 TaxID=3365609 RepID=UPI0037A93643
MPRSLVRARCLAAPPALAPTVCGSDRDKGDEAPAKAQAKETAPAGMAHQHTVPESEQATATFRDVEPKNES